MSKILVVEDQSDIRDLIVDWLSIEGHDIYQADNGKIGVELALKINPDLILTDMHMPIMDGETLIKTLYKEGYKGKIVVVTASVTVIDVKFIQKLGCTGFIPKPLDDDFYERVFSFLND